MTEKESTEYFQSRPRGSQVGAWALHQSRPVESRGSLETNVKDVQVGAHLWCCATYVVLVLVLCLKSASGFGNVLANVLANVRAYGCEAGSCRGDAPPSERLLSYPVIFLLCFFLLESYTKYLVLMVLLVICV